jgi:hypothetical protein
MRNVFSLLYQCIAVQYAKKRLFGRDTIISPLSKSIVNQKFRNPLKPQHHPILTNAAAGQKFHLFLTGAVGLSKFRPCQTDAAELSNFFLCMLCAKLPFLLVLRLHHWNFS